MTRWVQEGDFQDRTRSTAFWRVYNGEKKIDELTEEELNLKNAKQKKQFGAIKDHWKRIIAFDKKNSEVEVSVADVKRDDVRLTVTSGGLLVVQFSDAFYRLEEVAQKNILTELKSIIKEHNDLYPPEDGKQQVRFLPFEQDEKGLLKRTVVLLECNEACISDASMFNAKVAGALKTSHDLTGDMALRVTSLDPKSVSKAVPKPAKPAPKKKEKTEAKKSVGKEAKKKGREKSEAIPPTRATTPQTPKPRDTLNVKKKDSRTDKGLTSLALGANALAAATVASRKREQTVVRIPEKKVSKIEKQRIDWNDEMTRRSFYQKMMKDCVKREKGQIEIDCDKVLGLLSAQIGEGEKLDAEQAASFIDGLGEMVIELVDSGKAVTYKATGKFGQNLEKRIRKNVAERRAREARTLLGNKGNTR